MLTTHAIEASLPDGRSPTWSDTVKLNIGVGVIPDLRVRFLLGEDREAGYLPAVHMRLEFRFSEARYSTTFVGYEAPEVDGTDLRSLRVADLARQAANAGIFASLAGEPPQSLTGAYVWSDDKTYLADPGAKGPSPENLKEVAFVYQLALISSQHPAKAVSAYMGLAPRTAARWIARAKELGLLVRPQVAGREVDPKLMEAGDDLRITGQGVLDVTSDDLRRWGLGDGEHQAEA